MPILYHPQASYEFYIAPGSSSVSITASIFNVGGVTLDVETEVQSFVLNVLTEGSTDPANWAEFNIETEPARGNIADNPQLNYLYPARFLTPIIDEFTGGQEIRVLTHPYGGALTGGTELNGVDKVEFYLNDGPATLGTKTTDPVTGQGNIWSVQLPSGLTANLAEVRAKVFPKVGRVNILQGTGYKNAAQAETLYGFRAQNTSPYAGATYPAGIYPNRRGCIVQKGLTAYHISPTGSDDNDGLSIGQAKLTPTSVYSDAGSNAHKVKIINGYTSDTNARHAGEFILGDSGYTQFDELPIVEGGTVLWNQGSDNTGSNQIGVIFKNVDLRADVSQESTALNAISVPEARYVFIDCDLGIDAKADSHGGQFGVLEEQFNNGFQAGLRVELKQTSFQSPSFFYGCDFRYATASTSREGVDCNFILPPTQNDVINAQLLYNIKCRDVGALLYPYSSVGKGLFEFCPKGSANGYTGAGESAGVWTHEQVQQSFDVFYNTLGTSADPAGTPDGWRVGTPNAGVTLTGVTFDNIIAEWKVIDPTSTMINAYEALPNQGFWPDYVFAIRKIRAPHDRPAIDVGYFTGATSATNPIPYAGGTAHRGWVNKGGSKSSRDPHIDITQTFYESDFGGVSADGSLIRGPAKDGFVYNSLICELLVTGHYSKYQGIFFTANSRTDGLSIWNIDLQHDTTSGSASMMTISGGVAKSTEYNHFGPYIKNTKGQFKVRFQKPPLYLVPMKNIFFYETDGWVFPNLQEDPAGFYEAVDGWVSSPINKLSPVGISASYPGGQINSWLVTDNPYNVWREPVFRGFQIGGTLDGSVDGGGVRFVTPGACGDLTGPLGTLGGYPQSTSTLNYTNLGWHADLYRMGITGQHSSGILTDPQSGQTFQSWDASTPKPTRDELLATTYWLSSNGWRAIAGLTYNVGSTYEKYFEFIIADYSEAGTTWSPAFGIQNGYMQLSSSSVRNDIRDQIDSGFPQNYNVDGSSTFTYEGVPMQMTYYFEKRYR